MSADGYGTPLSRAILDTLPERSVRALPSGYAWVDDMEAALHADGYLLVSEAELAAAIADHGDICSRMAIPECAPAIFAALTGAAQEQGETG